MSRLNPVPGEIDLLLSSELLDAVAASAALPIPRAVFEDVIRASGKGVAASLRGFALAFDAISARRAQKAVVDAALQAAEAQAPDTPQDSPNQPVPPDQPPLQRGAKVQEMVRWLALWMAFDDIARVAAAKLAASRLDRVRREVGLRDGELLKVYDHFKPGMPEIAALLPPALGTHSL